MTEAHEPSTYEKAILAGGCFWGVQDLVRKLPGVVSTRVGYTGGDVPNATYRNHGNHAEAIEIVFDPHRISYRDLWSSSSRSTTRRQRTDRVTTSGPATGRRSSTRQTPKRTLPKRPSPTSRRLGCGPEGSSPKLLRPGPSGRPSQSTRTTWSAIPTVTRAISYAPAGSCHARADTASR